MTQSFDVIVLGTGEAGGPVARACRAAGWEVALVDERPFGGTCALRGCDPKKVLVGAADLMDWYRRMASRGVITGQAVHIDWPALMRFKRTFTDLVPQRVEADFVQAGIRTFHAHAAFAGPSSVRVGDDILTARHVVIATGARPATLDIAGEQQLTTSDDFLEIEELPGRLSFIGGGYIAFEFAHVAVRAGAEVTMLELLPRPLAGFDPDLVDTATRASEELGIRIHLNTKVEAVAKEADQWLVRTTGPAGPKTFSADLVVHAAGRTPNLDMLGLQEAGVAHGKKGVQVNEFLQSVTNPAVYAAGDAAATTTPQLTPVAVLEGEVVAENLLNGNRRKPNYGGLASVVFTVPPLAAAGLTEEAARQAGLEFTVKQGDTSSWYSSRRVGSKHSGYKVPIEHGTGRILGAHLLGLQAEEAINLFALAIRFQIPAKDLRDVLYTYPSHASDVSYML